MKSLTRRHFFRLMLPAVSLGALSLGRQVQGAEEGSTSDLKELLEKDLRARRPEEYAFINKVIKLVDEGDLPYSMVNGVYIWARKKRPHPFQYFQYAMRERARRVGVIL